MKRQHASSPTLTLPRGGERERDLSQSAINFPFSRRRTMKPLLAALAFLLCASHAAAQTLFQHPAMNRTHVVFAYADDLWSVPRTGGTAARLTSGSGLETGPFFSP